MESLTKWDVTQWEVTQASIQDLEGLWKVFGGMDLPGITTKTVRIFDLNFETQRSPGRGIGRGVLRISCSYDELAWERAAA